MSRTKIQKQGFFINTLYQLVSLAYNSYLNQVFLVSIGTKFQLSSLF